MPTIDHGNPGIIDEFLIIRGDPFPRKPERHRFRDPFFTDIRSLAQVEPGGAISEKIEPLHQPMQPNTSLWHSGRPKARQRNDHRPRNAKG